MRRLSSRRKKSTSTCTKILKCMLWFFIITNILLFYYLYTTYQQPDCLRIGTCSINNKGRTLPREKWGQTLYMNVLNKYFTRYGNEWRLSDSLSTQSFGSLNCSSLRNFEKVRFVAAGYTKSTFKVKFKNQTLSLKTVNTDGHDVNSCLLHRDRYLNDCFLLAASKLLKEIAILNSISHNNIVKVLGYCIPSDPDISDPKQTVALFEEYGEPVDVIKLLQLSWEDRLRISLGLSRLLKHLSSFEETVALNDFRRQQFIVIDGEPKLIDVDDVGLEEQKCQGSPCCSYQASINHTLCVPCVKDVCRGYNEKLNIVRTGKHFIKHILPHGAPPAFTAVSKRIATAFQFAEWDADSIWREMENLVRTFKEGLYRSSNKNQYLAGYKAYNHKDVSSHFDYRCPLTISGYGCRTSVLDAEEAAELCWIDTKCKAFVLTNVTTWTGRKIVHFKSGFGNLLHNNKTKLFLKL